MNKNVLIVTNGKSMTDKTVADLLKEGEMTISKMERPSKLGLPYEKPMCQACQKATWQVEARSPKGKSYKLCNACYEALRTRGWVKADEDIPEKRLTLAQLWCRLFHSQWHVIITNRFVDNFSTYKCLRCGRIFKKAYRAPFAKRS